MRYTNVTSHRRARPGIVEGPAQAKQASTAVGETAARGNVTALIPMRTDKRPVIRAKRKEMTAEENRSLRREIHEKQAAVVAGALSANVQPLTTARWRRFTGAYAADDFATIRIAFEGGSTKYDWGEKLANVNSTVFQLYFRQARTSADIKIKGIDPATAGNVVWGNVVLGIQDLRYSSRFGGSFHVRVTPIEDYGIELVDAAKNLYVNLEKWMIHLYIQPTVGLFNLPNSAYTSLTARTVVELEVTESEAYERSGSIFVPHTTAQESDIKALIDRATADARARLLDLGLYTLGFVHNEHLPDFNPISEKVTEIYLSNNLCRFETEIKQPYVAVLMECYYFGTGALEGPFDNDAEVTAEPWIILRQAPWVVMSNSQEKYIGSASGTGFMTMGYLSLEDMARVNEVTAFAGWTESDPLIDDWGGALGFVFDVAFDLADLTSRADANQLGPVGPELFDVQQDIIEEVVTYGVRIKFALVKF